MTVFESSDTKKAIRLVLRTTQDGFSNLAFQLPFNNGTRPRKSATKSS